MKISEIKLKNIITESLKNVLKESFNDNKIANAIKEHGGLDSTNKRWSAAFNADFDLKNSKYCGYLSPKTMEELNTTGLSFYLRKYILYTKDGGAIVIEKVYSSEDSWNDKVRTRNQKWGENGPNKEAFERFGSRRETYIYPNEGNTLSRRQERKNI